MARERKKENKPNKEQTKTASNSSTRFLVSSLVSLCVIKHNGTMAWHTHTRYLFKYTLGPSSAETDPCSLPKTSFSSDNTTENPNPVKAVYLHTLPPSQPLLTSLLFSRNPTPSPNPITPANKREPINQSGYSQLPPLNDTTTTTMLLRLLPDLLLIFLIVMRLLLLLRLLILPIMILLWLFERDDGLVHRKIDRIRQEW
jgi:hypothetical protein